MKLNDLRRAGDLPSLLAALIHFDGRGGRQLRGQHPAGEPVAPAPLSGPGEGHRRRRQRRHGGVEVGRAIVVDDAMRTSVPAAGRPAAFHGAVPATRLKVAEIGRMDTRAGTYMKLVVRGDRLQGVILMGDTALGAQLSELMCTGEPGPAALLSASSAGSAQAALADQGDDPLVCACMSVTRGTIVEAARRDGLCDVDAFDHARRGRSAAAAERARCDKSASPRCACHIKQPE